MICGESLFLVHKQNICRVPTLLHVRSQKKKIKLKSTHRVQTPFNSRPIIHHDISSCPTVGFCTVFSPLQYIAHNIGISISPSTDGQFSNYKFHVRIADISCRSEWMYNAPELCEFCIPKLHLTLAPHRPRETCCVCVDCRSPLRGSVEASCPIARWPT